MLSLILHEGDVLAQKIVTMLVDDLDGSTAEETVSFSLDGKSFTIDLSASHAQQLRECLQPYMDSARKSGRTGGPRVAATPVHDRAELAAAREWLRAHGETVSDKGRIAAVQLDRYYAATAYTA